MLLASNLSHYLQIFFVYLFFPMEIISLGTDISLRTCLLCRLRGGLCSCCSKLSPCKSTREDNALGGMWKAGPAGHFSPPGITGILLWLSGSIHILTCQEKAISGDSVEADMCWGFLLTGTHALSRGKACSFHLVFDFMVILAASPASSYLILKTIICVGISSHVIEKSWKLRKLRPWAEVRLLV